MRKIVLTICCLAGIVACTSRCLAAEPLDDRVRKSIERAQRYLWATQQPEGNWHALGAKYVAGPTAVATYALLASGVNPQDPRLAKALEWLSSQDEVRGTQMQMEDVDPRRTRLVQLQANHNRTPVLEAELKKLQEELNRVDRLSAEVASLTKQIEDIKNNKKIGGMERVNKIRTLKEELDKKSKQLKKLNKVVTRQKVPVGVTKLRKAGKGLSKKFPTQLTYTLAMRCSTWNLANQSTFDKYKHVLKRDANMLVKGHARGAYSYDCPNKGGWCNSNSQMAVLGVWAAARNDLKVPKKFWNAIRDHWLTTQRADGGWAYTTAQSTSAMSASGVATLYILLDNLYASEFVNKKADAKKMEFMKRIERGLAWLDKHFKATLGLVPPPAPYNKVKSAYSHLMGHSDLYYYLYAVERVGLASGYKNFGDQDWYKIGAAKLLSLQKPNGSWGGAHTTGFAILFLTRGQHPVAFNKLQYPGDWANRPRDLAMLTRWMSQTFEHTMNWQIVNLRNTPLPDWHDAPILYISGDQAPSFSDTDLQKLRKYVLQGGTLLSVTEFNGKDFDKSMREVYKKLFPQYELKLAQPGHPIYSKDVYYDLGNKVQLMIMSNGVRPLAIHTKVDLPRHWQSGKVNDSTRIYYEAGLNIARYVTGSLTNLRNRAVSHWPAPSTKAFTRKVSVARLKFDGNCNPEPLAFDRLAIMMREQTGTNLEVKGPIEISALPASGAKIATLSGTGTIKLSKAQLSVLKKFVEGGGTLIIDAVGGDREFAKSAEKVLRKIFRSRKNRPRQLSLRSDVYRLSGLQITDKDIRYRRRTHMRLKTKYPMLEAILIGQRPAVFFSSLDITAGLLGNSSYTIDGYHPDSAYLLMRNMILFASGAIKPAS